ncbi:MAG: hypothetical protein WA854_17520 [Candidatus Binataceae bacterium]
MKFLSDILTGKDNLTYDAARVVGVLGALSYIVFWCIQVGITRHFGATDADAYGRGLGVVMLAMAGACAIKRSTEPDPIADLSDERRLADGRGENRPDGRGDNRPENRPGEGLDNRAGVR